MERSQKKIHRIDELTWTAHILTCSPHDSSHVLALNGTSLLAVTCPCKSQAGWPFWCPYRNVVFFSLEPCTGRPTLKSHRSKLGLRSTSSNAITLAIKVPDRKTLMWSCSQGRIQDFSRGEGEGLAGTDGRTQKILQFEN